MTFSNRATKIRDFEKLTHWEAQSPHNEDPWELQVTFVNVGKNFEFQFDDRHTDRQTL